MNNNRNERICTTVGYVSGLLGITVSDVNDMLGLICTILCIVSMVLTLIIKIVGYLKNDGKLDKNEIKDISNDINKINDKIKDIKEKGKEEDNKHE